jgi:pSer/pThr/pTyr-binding forkhead associated (FHA) protein
MRLTIKQVDRKINELRFTRGPIYIGRHTNSQVFLPGKAVSRQHAVIYYTQEGKWMLEDLDSANKTYLNGEAIRKAEIKTGDNIRIDAFTIEVNLENGVDAAQQIHLEDTLVTPTQGLQIIIREITVITAPDLRMPARRAKDFAQATEVICETDNLDDVLKTLISIALRQFAAFHVWGTLRNQTSGPMTCQAGKRRDGEPVNFNEIKLGGKITQAVEKGQFLLLPRLPEQREENIQSAMIAPIIGPGGCFGALYVDNAMDHEHYNLSDLDYLMLLAIHTATIIKNF